MEHRKIPKYIVQSTEFQNIGSFKLGNQRKSRWKVSTGPFKPTLLRLGWTKKAQHGLKWWTIQFSIKWDRVQPVLFTTTRTKSRRNFVLWCKTEIAKPCTSLQDGGSSDFESLSPRVTSKKPPKERSQNPQAWLGLSIVKFHVKRRCLKKFFVFKSSKQPQQCLAPQTSTLLLVFSQDSSLFVDSTSSTTLTLEFYFVVLPSVPRHCCFYHILMMTEGGRNVDKMM